MSKKRIILSEAAYIHVGNKTLLTVALAALRDILPDDGGPIDDKELRAITRTLSKWQQAHFDTMETRPS